MKKIIFGMMVAFGGFVFAQNYPDYYPTNGNYNNNGYYSDNYDQYYFPEDYYYEYPSDYYSDDLYNGYYNDYQRSINNVNWNRFFVENRLSPWQIQQMIYLNQMHSNFASWNQYYRFNPDRWYYDRYYAIQQILGPQIFVTFQNVYFGGYSPIVYYRNYRVNHYRPVVFVQPRYRNINVNIYRVDRHNYHQNNGYFYNSRQGGFRNETRSGANGNFNNNGSFGNNGGFRNENSIRNNTRFENNSVNSSNNNGGFRNGSSNNGNPRVENNSGTRSNNSGGFRTPNTNSNSGNSDGFRKSSGGERIQQKQNTPERKSTPSNNNRSGQRFVNR